MSGCSNKCGYCDRHGRCYHNGVWVGKKTTGERPMPNLNKLKRKYDERRIA